MSTPPKNNGPRTHAPENGRDNAKAAILLYDWIEGEKGAFDKISEARSELFLSNASTMRPMMSQPAPPPIFCATLGKMKVPMLVTRGERDNSFYVLKTDTFASCLPPWKPRCNHPDQSEAWLAVRRFQDIVTELKRGADALHLSQIAEFLCVYHEAGVLGPAAGYVMMVLLLWRQCDGRIRTVAKIGGAGQRRHATCQYPPPAG
jgi:hypothetical protein